VITVGLRAPGRRVADARPGHVKVTRDWISCAVTWHDCPVGPGDAAPAAGELVTNVVMHGAAGGACYRAWSVGARLVAVGSSGRHGALCRRVSGRGCGFPARSAMSGTTTELGGAWQFFWPWVEPIGRTDDPVAAAGSVLVAVCLDVCGGCDE
jgi:hypothetical protein